MHGRDEKCIQNFGRIAGRDHSEDLGVGDKIILEWILGKWSGEGVDWIHLAQDRDQWRAAMNTVMNLWVP
jgi:hypothetical protein